MDGMRVINSQMDGEMRKMRPFSGRFRKPVPQRVCSASRGVSMDDCTYGIRIRITPIVDAPMDPFRLSSTLNTWCLLFLVQSHLAQLSFHTTPRDRHSASVKHRSSKKSEARSHRVVCFC